MKVFLLLGQSNMAGPHIAKWDESDDERVRGTLLLNASDEWEAAKNPLNRYSTIEFQHVPGLNPGATFAEEMKKAFPNEKTGLISNARGSTRIAEWQKDDRYFDEAVRRAKACGEKIAAILWLQGEDDALKASDFEDYAPRFEAFIRDLREALGDEGIPFIACEIWGDVEPDNEEERRGAVRVNEQIAAVIAKTANCAMISSKGAAHVTEDPVHFSPEGMRTLGRRYAAEYIHKWA